MPAFEPAIKRVLHINIVKDKEFCNQAFSFLVQTVVMLLRFRCLASSSGRRSHLYCRNNIEQTEDEVRFVSDLCEKKKQHFIYCFWY